MEKQSKQPQPVSNTIQSKTRSARQAGIQKVLQKYAAVQRTEMPEEDELLQGKFETAQREELDDEEPVQGKFDLADSAGANRKEVASANNTGLPDNLKSGIESLSGYNMDSVRVHFNSPQPAQLQALAYTQGTDIHVAPGQEQHLPHEAWHVVQQMQGRVQPTMQLRGVNVNDNDGLEREADVMGARSVLEKVDNNISFNKGEGKLNSGISVLQRKIVFRDQNIEIQGEPGKNGGGLFGRVAKAVKNDGFTKSEKEFYYRNYFITRSEFDKAIDINLKSEDNLIFANAKGGDVLPLGLASFLLRAIEQLAPNAENFEIKKPEVGKINIQYLKSRFGLYIPKNKNQKEPGYVVNIASYYNEGGVQGIVKKYFADAISGNNEMKSKRMAVVVGLNSFSSVIENDYNSQIAGINNKIQALEMPDYNVNFRGFGFLWEPYWTFENIALKDGMWKLRRAIENRPHTDADKFKEKQKKLSEFYPYGVFREEVMKSQHTQNMVKRLSAWNDPVYIYSGDGDAISLRVPNEHDTGMSDMGVVDKYDEHFKNKGTNATIVIGGYNLYELNENKILQEIVKADDRVAKYQDDTDINKTQPSFNLDDYKDKEYLQKKIQQIVHNTQVGNRYDRIVRDAISTIYPKMLYPTEPNMLIKAKDTSQKYDFFESNELLNGQGKLWGMGASEGRVLKENLEKKYNSGNKQGFIDWVKGASIPTDPRGFNRHLIISGYEKYPDDESQWPPFDVYHESKKGHKIDLYVAAVQQAQSYTSAYRLAELYAQASMDNLILFPKIQSENLQQRKERIRKMVKPAFDKVEEMIAYMMKGSVKKETLFAQKVESTGENEYDKISLKIRDELFVKWKFYNGIP